MKKIITLIVIFGIALNIEAFGAGDKWDDLKVTWGINPFGSGNFVSLPRTEQEAIGKGWAKEKSCGQVNGNRYVQPTGDRLVIKSNQQEINVALKESEVASFWTKGQCFWTMVQKFFLIYDKIYFKFYFILCLFGSFFRRVYIIGLI